jgi:hypothetical protein
VVDATDDTSENEGGDDATDDDDPTTSRLEETDEAEEGRTTNEFSNDFGILCCERNDSALGELF